MSNDLGEFHRRSGNGEDYTSKNTYRRGITAYERPHGMRNRKNNPYRRSNMIYAKRSRRKWPVVVAVVLLVAAAGGVTVFACTAGGEQDSQQMEQVQESQQAEEVQEQPQGAK